MIDVIPFPSTEEDQTPEDLHRDVENYIDRVVRREDPKLQKEVRRDMQKGYMRMGTRSNPTTEEASNNEREGE